MNIDKDKLIKLIDDNLDVVYTDEDMDGLVKVVNEIIKLFTPSTIKERLYRGIIERELETKYDAVGDCRACGKQRPRVMGKKIDHYRRCPTAQMERIANL